MRSTGTGTCSCPCGFDKSGRVSHGSRVVARHSRPGSDAGPSCLWMPRRLLGLLAADGAAAPMISGNLRGAPFGRPSKSKGVVSLQGIWRVDLCARRQQHVRNHIL